MGVGKHDGLTVFVPFTAIGDLAEVKVLKADKNALFCKLIRVIVHSPDRIPTDSADSQTSGFCPKFGLCGGCDFRHISYESELRAKENFVRDAFTRIGRLNPEFLPILSCGIVDRYRNKAQYPVGKSADGRVIAGFYANRSHRIVPCHDCLLHPEIFSQIKNFIVDYIRANRLSVYDESTHSGVIRHICIRQGHYSGEINVCIVARRRIPEFAKLARAIASGFEQVKGVVLNINPDKTNVIYGEREYILHGKPDIVDTMCGLGFAISPRSFYQVNTPAAEMLYRQIHEFVLGENNDKKVTSTVLDLYCGIGTIGLSLARKCEKVVGIEVNPQSVSNARDNCKRNSVDNVEFVCGDASEIPDISPDVVIVDPARKGCDIRVLERVAELSPGQIIVVSCDPATAARDCARLGEFGYETRRVRAADLFPRTRHAECVAELVKSG
jgi:23S rRNA (uracil1939-C5)-methyltransferase